MSCDLQTDNVISLKGDRRTRCLIRHSYRGELEESGDMPVCRVLLTNSELVK